MSTGYNSKSEIRDMFEKGKDMSKINCILPKESTDGIDNNGIKRVAVYCRVSTDGIGQTVSFEIQKKYYIKYVRSNPGWKLCGVYSDEGISATTTKNRIGLQMLINDAKAGKIDLIVIKSISRFCRNLEDSIRIINELKALPKPVGIYFETERISTLDPSMDLIIKVLSMVAEEESKKKSEAIIGSLRARYSEGFFLVYAVLGYKRTGVNEIDIDEAEAVTVRLIYDMYLAGFSEEEIAETLVGLGRKKHTHHYLDGRIKEGKTDWKASNIHNVFDNEKRCGDVLAQKTYTYDCIEHIVRKNDRKVAQYYGKDQHDAIISREQFYLALRLRNSNRGGWTQGIQVLKTYVGGRLKGYVRVIPRWYGFETSDYVLASLRAYGVDVPEKSLYPDYVMMCNDTENTSRNPDTEEHEFNHYYAVSDQEFLTEPVITQDEYEQLQEKEPEYISALLSVKDELNSRLDEIKKCPGLARAWNFSMKEKKLMTLDKGGITFNNACYLQLGTNMVEMYYSPVEDKVIIKDYCGSEDVPYALKWRRKVGNAYSMMRCPAPAICDVIFACMNWNKSFKYTIFGRNIKIAGEMCIEFVLKYPMVKVKYSVMSDNQENIQPDKLEIAMEEARNTGAFFSESEEDAGKIAEYLTGKVENKSRAVYFNDDVLNKENPVSLNDYWHDMYNPEFIKMLREKGIAPIEGWGYLKDYVRWQDDGFELFPIYLPIADNDNPSKDENVECIAEEFGWTTHYQFPEKKTVLEKIKRLKDEYENFDVG